jgi:TolB protein
MLPLSTSYRRTALAVGALCLALATTACQGAAASTLPSPTPSPAAAPGVSATAAPGTTEAARSVAGVPGALFYLTADDRLVRRTLTGGLLTLGAEAWGADVSPDGRRVARIEPDGDVLVTDREGDAPRRLLRNAAPDGIGPAWSPDGTTLLVARSDGDAPARPGLLDVATGRFSELPALHRGLHPRWSGDGRTVAYTDGECRLMTGTVDGRERRPVPALSDPSRRRNPSGAFACDVVSVNRDGTRLAVDLKGPAEPAGDIVGDLTADTVIDTATGATVALPVRGTVLAVLYRPDGSMLVRSRLGKVTTLTVWGPDGTRVARAVEPAAMRDVDLMAWTR